MLLGYHKPCWSHLISCRWPLLNRDMEQSFKTSRN
jgi:hypothetical protein